METSEEHLKQLEEKIDAIYASVEKSRKYVLIMVIVTLATIVIPILLGAVMLPTILNTIGSAYGI